VQFATPCWDHSGRGSNFLLKSIEFLILWLDRCTIPAWDFSPNPTFEGALARLHLSPSKLLQGCCARGNFLTNGLPDLGGPNGN
jgi:hypothetical protein